MKIIGNKQYLQELLDIFYEININPDKKYFIMIEGSYGIGKSFFLKNYLKQISKLMEEGKCNRFKYGEFINIFISLFSPIKGTLKMNGMR